MWVFHSMSLIKHTRDPLSRLVQQFQHVVECNGVILNSVYLEAHSTVCRDSQTFFFFFAAVKVEEQESGWGWDQSWKNWSRTCMYRTCLWMHIKGLVLAYLDVVNKTKNETGLNLAKQIEPGNYDSNICAWWVNTSLLLGHMNNCRSWCNYATVFA